MIMLANMDVDVKSTRFDRYYSFPTYVDKFDGSCKVYVMPRKNSTLNGSQKWKCTMKEFTKGTMEYLEQYHLRGNSESGFAADKKMLG